MTFFLHMTDCQFFISLQYHNAVVYELHIGKKMSNPRVSNTHFRSGDRAFQGEGRGVQVAVLLGSYFGTHLVLNVSNFPEEIVSKGDEHRLARQKVISAWLA